MGPTVSFLYKMTKSIPKHLFTKNKKENKIRNKKYIRKNKNIIETTATR